MRAAREAFVRDGPKIAVAEIAQQLGVSAAALFQRVGSKTQLMLLSLLPGVPPSLEALAKGPEADPSISQQLHAHLLALMTFLQAVVPGLIVLRAAGLFPPPRKRGKVAAGDAAPHVPSPIALREQLASWLQKAQRDGRIRVLDAQVAAEALLGAMEARCFNAHVGGPDYVRGSDADFLRQLIAGLLVELESPAASR